MANRDESGSWSEANKPALDHEDGETCWLVGKMVEVLDGNGGVRVTFQPGEWVRGENGLTIRS